MTTSKCCGGGAILQLVAYGVSDIFFHINTSSAVPYNAKEGDVLNPLEGRVPTKEQWHFEIENKLQNFDGLHYNPSVDR